MDLLCYVLYCVRLCKVGDKSRNDARWVKMKPEYSDQTADLDLLILGAAFASGKMRSGLLSKFILGVAVPTDDGGPPTQFWPITRVRERLASRLVRFCAAKLGNVDCFPAVESRLASPVA